MKLPFSFPFGKKEKIEYFLALLLRDEKVSAVIFEEINGKIKIIGEHHEYFSDSVDNVNIDEFIEALDKTISSAENALPSNIETQKTIFGLKENWIEEAHIKKEYLAKLKKISKELNLVPIGFLVIHEAIAHLLQEEEGVPISAILIEIDRKNLAISLLRGGKIAETKRAKIENSIPKTTDKLLHSFTNYEVLPSRILLFDDKDSEKISQNFINHQWSKSLPFLHVPQVTPLVYGFDARAVVSGAATQMGFEILEEEAESPIKTKHERIEQGLDEIEAPNEDFGFLKEEDIAKKEGMKKDDLKEEMNFREVAIKEAEEQEEFEDWQNKEPLEKNKQALKIPHELKKMLIKSLSLVNLSLLKKIKISSVRVINNSHRTVLFLSVFILFFIAMIISYLFLVKATIVIKINPKIVEQNQTIIFSLSAGTDFAKNIIKGELISASIEGKLTTQTTGKKEIGEKAKGTITIYSRFPQSKILNEGTVIKGPNDLQFTLDQTITLASASADASSAPITKNTSVTAKNIGKEFNLPSGVKFSVGSFDTTDIIAKNESVFSGGLKKEITAVSKDDVAKLISDLPKNLEEKARDDFSKKAGAEKSILPVFTNTALEKKVLNNQVGDEANSVTLNATVKFEGLAYQKKDIDNYIENLIKNKASGNFTFSKNEIKTDIKDVRVKDNKEVNTVLNIKAGLMPDINNSKLIQEISGKSFDQTKIIITRYPQVSDVEINLQPNLPIFPKIMPRFSGNISIKTIKNE